MLKRELYRKLLKPYDRKTGAEAVILLVTEERNGIAVLRSDEEPESTTWHMVKWYALWQRDAALEYAVGYAEAASLPRLDEN